MNLWVKWKSKKWRNSRRSWKKKQILEELIKLSISFKEWYVLGSLISIFILRLKHIIYQQENQIRSEKKRKEDEAKQHEERQVQIEAMNEGKFPHFATQGNFNL